MTRPERPQPPLADVRTLLTPRQLEVMELVGDGLSYKVIAVRLDISVRTVERHAAEAAERIKEFVGDDDGRTPYRRLYYWISRLTRVPHALAA